MKKLKDYFESFILYKKQKGFTKHTIGEYQRFIKDVLCCIAEKRLKDLRITDQALIQEYGRRHGYWGELRAVSVFLQFCKYLDDAGEKLPFSINKIKLPHTKDKEQEYLTPEEFEDLMSKLPTTFYGLRDRALYELLWSTGLRISEALGIQKSDIFFKEKEIKVHTAKGGEGDKVYICERLEYWLQRYLEIRQDSKPFLFVCYYGDCRPLTKIMARKNLANYRKEFGITKKIDHPSFRRGFATNLIENGATIKETQYLCRHRSERTTLKHYVKFDKIKVKDVHHKIFDNLVFKFKEKLLHIKQRA